MKKVFALFVLVVVLFAAGCSQADPVIQPSTAPTTTPTTEPTIAPTYAVSRDKEFNNLLNTVGTAETSGVLNNIPVYEELELLVRSYGQMFDLGRDACYYNVFPDMEFNYASSIFRRYPTNAIRVRVDGSSYAVYDTDTGFRFYLFFESDMPRTIGVPVVIKKGNILSLDDFKDIKVGDSIEKVESIDSITPLYKRRMTGLSPSGAEAIAQLGSPLSSVHYLKDGILKIEYTVPEKGTLIISKIVFSENFTVANGYGQETNQKILDIDLPIH
jgi:hypothetical protein